jgi:ribosome-binding ATPase YchF (GTP1/OBG family)
MDRGWWMLVMKVGLVGFSGSGKSTVFEWLTGAKPNPAKVLQEGQVGIAQVPDERLDWLSGHFKPKKTTYATLELVDTPGLLASERKDNPKRLNILRTADGLLVVLTGFSGDIVQEYKNFQSELLFADLEIITNRIDKLDTQLKKPRPAKERDNDQREQDLLKRIVAALEAGQSATSLGLHEEQEKLIRSFQLFTLKQEMVFLNIADDRLGKPVPPELLQLCPRVIQAPVKLELELAELPDADRTAFMQDLGVKELSRTRVIRELFAGMNRIVFLTVGEDECRAWPIPAGANAVTGAAQIHTDLADGFVRAEVVPYEDFKKLGSMKECKAKGVYRLESKTYLVKDGDIMHILANK